MFGPCFVIAPTPGGHADPLAGGISFILTERAMTTRRPSLVTFAASVLLAALSFHALAQNGAGATLDRATRMLHQKFVTADVDKDGFLTKEEADKGSMPTTAKYFADIDTSHRGKVSEAEIKSFLVNRAADRAKTP
jgi:hypothetical protein